MIFQYVREDFIKITSVSCNLIAQMSRSYLCTFTCVCSHSGRWERRQLTQICVQSYKSTYSDMGSNNTNSVFHGFTARETKIIYMKQLEAKKKQFQHCQTPLLFTFSSIEQNSIFCFFMTDFKRTTSDRDKFYSAQEK